MSLNIYGTWNCHDELEATEPKMLVWNLNWTMSRGFARNASMRQHQTTSLDNSRSSNNGSRQQQQWQLGLETQILEFSSPRYVFFSFSLFLFFLCHY